MRDHSRNRNKTFTVSLTLCPSSFLLVSSCPCSIRMGRKAFVSRAAAAARAAAAESDDSDSGAKGKKGAATEEPKEQAEASPSSIANTDAPSAPAAPAAALAASASASKASDNGQDEDEADPSAAGGKETRGHLVQRHKRVRLKCFISGLFFQPRPIPLSSRFLFAPSPSPSLHAPTQHTGAESPEGGLEAPGEEEEGRGRRGRCGPGRETRSGAEVARGHSLR